MRIFIQTIAFIFCLSAFGNAQPICPLEKGVIKPKGVKNLDAFKGIAILEEGRVKPLDTYAQNLLLRFSGRRTFDDKPAVDWLAKLLFAPETTKDDTIFLINHPEIANALNIEPQKNRRYSFAQIEPNFAKLTEIARAAYQIDVKNRDIVESEILRVYENINIYSSLSLTFSFALPHPDFTISDPQNLAMLQLPGQVPYFSFIDIAIRADALHKAMEPLQKTDPSSWGMAENEIVQLANNLFQWAMVYRDLPFTIIPEISKEGGWLSPWDAMSVGMKQSKRRQALVFLRDMTASYWNGQQMVFDLNIKNFKQSVASQLPPAQKDKLKSVSTELLFNKLNLLLTAKLLYGVILLLFLISFIVRHALVHKSALFLTSVAAVLHTVAIAMRMSILSRPPVSNLYETFIFVGIVSVLTGLFIELKTKNWIGLVIASISGLSFLMIADKFSSQGDTLQMLVAVLNSNFWLSTHVLSIVIGYAFVCVCGIIGHIYILQAVVKPKEKELLSSTYRLLLGTLALGLTMTFLGTNLGGIWADQSWGRFWGWDPKENGALLIIIWCALLLHLKVGNMIKPLGMAVGSVLGIIVVMWAWFGVNLLGVGLHSYGFTSGLALNLTIYVVIQTLFLIITVPIAKRRQIA